MKFKKQISMLLIVSMVLSMFFFLQINTGAFTIMHIQQ